MATVTRTKILAPSGARVVAQDGGHTKSWRSFYDDVARELSRRIVVVEAAVDPPNIPAGDSAKVTLTLTGAGLTRSMFAVASFDALNSDVTINAAVTADDVVTVTLVNRSASPIDMGSGTLRVRLEVP